MRCVGSQQLADRHPVDRVHLVRGHRVHGARLPPPGQHRGDREVARRQPQRRQLGEDLDPLGPSPVSSSASRSAVCAAVSPGSTEPPGKDTWPGCERMVWLRSVSSRSGPSGPSPKSISTALTRGSSSSGGMNRVRSWTVIERAASSTGRSQSGRPVGHRLTPRCSRTRSTTSSSESRPPVSLVGDLALLVDEEHRRHAADLRELVEALDVTARVGQRRVGDPALPGLLQRAAGVLVLEVDTEHGHPVAVLLVEGLQRRHLLLAGLAAGDPEAEHHRARSEERSTLVPPPRHGSVRSGSAPPPGPGTQSSMPVSALSCAQLGGVDLDLGGARPGTIWRLVVAAGQRRHEQHGGEHRRAGSLTRDPRCATAWQRSRGRSAPRRTTGTSAPPGRPRRPASARGSSAARARSGGG